MKRRWPFIALLLVGMGFVLGLTHLFKLRLDIGDVYPEYSSLRSDPLGVKALYESMESLVSVQRHYRPLWKLPTLPATSLFIIGLERSAWTMGEQDFKALEGFVIGGGRLVLAMYPHYQRLGTNRVESWLDQRRRQREAGPPKENSETEDHGPRRALRADDSLGKRVEIGAKWGVSFDYAPLARDKNHNYQPGWAELKAGTALPDAISWHSALHFDKLDPAWRVIYAREDHPVLIERGLGRGQIVLCSDSYFLSNEALRNEAHPALLAWLAGPATTVVFEETHLGVSEKPGIVALSRKYRLHGFAVGLLVLALLFIWKNSVSFLPYHEESSSRGELITGKESSAGFVNLLRRNIGSAEVLSVCLAEWEKSVLRDANRNADKLEQLRAVVRSEQALPAKQRDPVNTYKSICKMLAKAKIRR